MQVVDLSGFGVLSVGGDDAGEFLQGQLSSDCLALDDGQGQLSAYHTPGGRVIAVLKLFRLDPAFLLAMPIELVESVAARLQRFVLRSRVEINDVSRQSASIGIAEAKPNLAGNRATTTVGSDRLSILDLSGTAGMVEFVGTPEAVAALPGALSSSDEPHKIDWRLVYVRAGIPVIGTASSEAYVSQMLNLDLLDALDFGKGCYAGQEVIARTQNLGRIKRRMLRFAAVVEHPPKPGDPLYRDNQRIGDVILSAPAEDQRVEFLAVVRMNLANGNLVLDDNKPVEGLPLPYLVPEISDPTSGT